jgi:alpha-glucosidase (family GH31 glycosyl hydrolase)
VRLLAATSLLVLLLAACGDDAPPPAPPLDATLGAFAVHLVAKPPRVYITDADGHVLIDTGGGADAPGRIEVGHADASFQTNFGAFKIQESGREITNVAALGDLHVDEAGALAFQLLDDGGATIGEGLIAAGTSADELVITYRATRATDDRVGFGFLCAQDEHFLGLGGQSFSVDHHGENVPIWVQEDGIGKEDLADDDYTGIWFLAGRRHSTHTPMPIYHSSYGYSLWLETAYRSIFDLCAADPQLVQVEAWEPSLRLHLFAGATLAARVRTVAARLGRPALPPPFTFAPWLDALHGPDNVRRVAHKLRDLGVPASVIWTEDWRGGSFEGDQYVLDEDWDVDPVLYPDFGALAADLHDLGFKLLTYENSFLDTTGDTFPEAAAGGYTIRAPGSSQPYLFDGVKLNPTSMLDLSSPAARAWATQKFRDGLELGADGYMADFAEWLPTDAVLASGEPGEAAHNLYPVEWQKLHKALFDTLHAADGVDRLFFVRSAYVGSQPLVSVVWAGDQQTDFSVGDGFPSVIPIGLGLGLTGFPYYGHDIGGYMSQGTVPTSEELWYRWVTLGALSPVMRTHHGRSVNANWSWETDAAATAHFARWATLHIRLFPYLYAMARRAADAGDPMFRALAFDYPGDQQAWTTVDEFLLGDRILVAPVVRQGALARDVHLPPGEWFPLLGGARVHGGADPVHVDAPVAEIPAFVPAGALLVLLPEGVQTLAPAAASAPVSGLAEAGDDRELWLWPSGQTTARLDEAQGALGYAWQSAGLTGPLSGAVWNGAPVAAEPDGSYHLTGNGTLGVNDGEAELTVSGGAADRRLVVRVLGLD